MCARPEANQSPGSEALIARRHTRAAGVAERVGRMKLLRSLADTAVAQPQSSIFRFYGVHKVIESLAINIDPRMPVARLAEVYARTAVAGEGEIANTNVVFLPQYLQAGEASDITGPTSRAMTEPAS